MHGRVRDEEQQTKIRALIVIAACLALGPMGCATPSLTEPTTAEVKPKPKKVNTRQKALAAGTARGTPQIAREKPPIASGPPAEALSSEEVSSLLAGNSVYAGGSGFQFAALHQDGGALKGKSWSGDATDTGAGNWKVEQNGAYCRKWNNSWAGGEWGCFKVFRKGNALTMERVSGAGANGKMTLVEGNAYGL